MFEIKILKYYGVLLLSTISLKKSDTIWLILQEKIIINIAESIFVDKITLAPGAVIT